MTEFDAKKGRSYYAAVVRESMLPSYLIRPEKDRTYYVMQPIDFSEAEEARDSGKDICVIMKTEEGELSVARYLSVLEENKQLRVQTERLKDSLVELNQEFARAVARPSE